MNRVVFQAWDRNQGKQEYWKGIMECCNTGGMGPVEDLFLEPIIPALHHSTIPAL